MRKRTKRPRNTRVTREGERARDNPKAENAAGVRGDVIDPPRIVTSDQAPGTRLRLSGCATARVGTWSVARRAAWQYRGTLFARWTYNNKAHLIRRVRGGSSCCSAIAAVAAAVAARRRRQRWRGTVVRRLARAICGGVAVSGGVIRSSSCEGHGATRHRRKHARTGIFHRPLTYTICPNDRPPPSRPAARRPAAHLFARSRRHRARGRRRELRLRSS